MLNIQKELTELDSPLVTQDNVFNTLERLVEATGLKGADSYFTNPNEMSEEEQESRAIRQEELQADKQFQKDIEVKKLQQKDEEIAIKKADSEAKAFQAVGNTLSKGF